MPGIPGMAPEGDAGGVALVDDPWSRAPENTPAPAAASAIAMMAPRLVRRRSGGGGGGGSPSSAAVANGLILKG
jgi:hypothetical protein